MLCVSNFMLEINNKIVMNKTVMIFVVAGLVLAGMVWLYIRMPGADRSNPFELFPLLVAFILIAFALLLGFKRLRSARGGGFGEYGEFLQKRKVGIGGSTD